MRHGGIPSPAPSTLRLALGSVKVVVRLVVAVAP
jgi:hypothetical protein